MKRLTYFQVHKNKKPKKVNYYFTKESYNRICKELEISFDMLLGSVYKNPF